LHKGTVGRAPPEEGRGGGRKEINSILSLYAVPLGERREAAEKSDSFSTGSGWGRAVLGGRGSWRGEDISLAIKEPRSSTEKKERREGMGGSGRGGGGGGGEVSIRLASGKKKGRPALLYHHLKGSKRKKKGKPPGSPHKRSEILGSKVQRGKKNERVLRSEKPEEKRERRGEDQDRFRRFGEQEKKQHGGGGPGG